MRTLLISAAEPSGDRLAAELVLALSEHGPVRARGIAGPLMRQAQRQPLKILHGGASVRASDAAFSDTAVSYFSDIAANSV